jgi:Family of unknown function (DUF6152)
MRAYILGGLIVAGVLLTSVRSTAHHSFAAEFDRGKQVKLTGIVTKVEWTNPHVWFYFNVKSAERSPDGGKTWVPGDAKGNWGAEMGPPHGLQRTGWRRDTLKLGEEVTVIGSLAKNGTSRMNASTVTLTATGGRPRETLDAVSSQGSNP